MNHIFSTVGELILCESNGEKKFFLIRWREKSHALETSKTNQKFCYISPFFDIVNIAYFLSGTSLGGLNRPLIDYLYGSQKLLLNKFVRASGAAKR